MNTITVHTVNTKKGAVSIGSPCNFNPNSTFMANFHYNGTFTNRKKESFRIYTSYINGRAYYAIPVDVAEQYPNIGSIGSVQLWSQLNN